MITVIVVLFMVAAQEPSGAHAQPHADLRRDLESIALSYQANKEAFLFGSFRFEYTEGTASNEDDALAGRYTRSVKSQGLYIFDQQNWRFEIIYEPKDVADATTRINDSQVRSSLKPVRVLSDGKVTLVDQPFLDSSGSTLLHRPQITPGMKSLLRNVSFPLGIGLDPAPDEIDLHEALKLVKEGRLSVKEVDFNSRMDGVDTCKLVLESERDERTYWIDLNRGSVPLRVAISAKSRDPATRACLVNQDLAFVKALGWLPRLQRVSLLGGGVAKQLAVTQINVDTKPSESDFQLEFPVAVSLYDNPRSLTYSPRKVWNLHRLPARNSRESTFSPVTSFYPPPELPGATTRVFPWQSVFIGSSCAVLTVLVFRGVRAIFRSSR